MESENASEPQEKLDSTAKIFTVLERNEYQTNSDSLHCLSTHDLPSVHFVNEGNKHGHITAEESEGKNTLGKGISTNACVSTTDLKVRPWTPEDLQVKEGYCQVCMEEALVWQSDCCQFKICIPCLDTYLTDKVDSGVIDIMCPGSKCKKILDSKLIKKVLTTDKSGRLSYLRAKHGRYTNRKVCPFCDHVKIFDGKAAITGRSEQVSCVICKRIWCSLCSGPLHGSKSCDHHIERLTGVKRWAKKWYMGRNARKCPRCGVSHFA